MPDIFMYGFWPGQPKSISAPWDGFRSLHPDCYGRKKIIPGDVDKVRAALWHRNVGSRPAYSHPLCRDQGEAIAEAVEEAREPGMGDR